MQNGLCLVRGVVRKTFDPEGEFTQRSQRSQRNGRLRMMGPLMQIGLCLVRGVVRKTFDPEGEFTQRSQRSQRNGRLRMMGPLMQIGLCLVRAVSCAKPSILKKNSHRDRKDRKGTDGLLDEFT